MSLPLKAPPYGRDMSCTDRIRPGTMVSGAVLLGEACLRRLKTRRGQLQYDGDYGYSLEERLGEELTEDDIAAIPDEINGELRKDPRIDRVEITQTRVDVAQKVVLEHEIRGFGVDGSGFALAIRSSEVGTELLGLEAV